MSGSPDDDSNERSDGDEPSHDWDEYKLIQDKIDKVAAFGFQAKGWSITLVAAVLVASKQAGLDLFAMVIAVPLVLVFWMFDAREGRWKRALYSRAEVLERRLAKRTDSFRALSRTERGPRSLGNAFRYAERHLDDDWRGWLIRRSDGAFHLFQLVLSLTVPFGMHFREKAPGVRMHTVRGVPRTRKLLVWYRCSIVTVAPTCFLIFVSGSIQRYAEIFSDSKYWFDEIRCRLHRFSIGSSLLGSHASGSISLS